LSSYNRRSEKDKNREIALKSGSSHRCRRRWLDVGQAQANGVVAHQQLVGTTGQHRRLDGLAVAAQALETRAAQ
jgi:hypothetical protein